MYSWSALTQRIVGLAVAVCLVAGSQAFAGGSIFDDDFVPPPTGETHPATAPAPIPGPSPDVVVPPALPTPLQPVVPPTLPPTTGKATVPGDVPPATQQSEIARRTVPPKESLDRSRTLLKEVFARQLADRSIPARHKLAQTLLKEAAKASDNAPDQFVLYGGALNAAKEAADLRLVIAVADEMGNTYVVDPLQVKALAAQSMPFKGEAQRNTIDNVLAGLELIDRLVAADELAIATRLCGLLRPQAAGEPGLLAAIQKRQQDISFIHTNHDRVNAQLEKLKSAPDDPVANSSVGSFLCFDVGNWPKGLPMLAKGSDMELKKLATDELSTLSDTQLLLKLADGWWTVATRQPPAAQAIIHQHAAAIYGQCTGKFTALQRIKIDQRIAEAAKGSAGSAEVSAGLREVIVRQKIAELKDFADSYSAKSTSPREKFPVADPLEGDVTWAANKADYSLTAEVDVGYNSGNHGKKLKDRSAKVSVDPGFHLEGGTILVSKGSLEMHGEPQNPVVLKNVHIGCELTGAVSASNVIFDHCTFTEDGPYGWIGFPNAKYTFADCLLLQSNFKQFSFGNYGIKLDRCTFAGCKFPDRNGKPGKSEDSLKTAQHEWSHVADSEFYDCEVSTSVFWMPRRCNFFHCKTLDTAAYQSSSDLIVELGLVPEERDALTNDLKAKTTMSGTGHVTFTSATALFETKAFPAAAESR